MWFRYPAGWDNVNVEGLEFHVDHKDRDGNQYFTAPDSLADKILVVPGFAVVQRPQDAPSDIKDATPLSVVDPLAQLSAQVEQLRLENQTLKDGTAALTKERDDAKAEVAALTAELVRQGGGEPTPPPTTPTPAPPTPPPPSVETKPAPTASTSSGSGTKK